MSQIHTAVCTHVNDVITQIVKLQGNKLTLAKSCISRTTDAFNFSTDRYIRCTNAENDSFLSFITFIIIRLLCIAVTKAAGYI